MKKNISQKCFIKYKRKRRVAKLLLLWVYKIKKYLILNLLYNKSKNHYEANLQRERKPTCTVNVANLKKKNTLEGKDDVWQRHN